RLFRPVSHSQATDKPKLKETDSWTMTRRSRGSLFRCLPSPSPPAQHCRSRRFGAAIPLELVTVGSGRSLQSQKMRSRTATHGVYQDLV
ncbi:MAG: hypothetical protein AAF889_02755, partial [Cyanobacteria bacterium P01_D01_bin.73]